MTTDTRILLADDHALVRRGVRLILDDSPGLCVVAEASDGAEAVTLARAEDVDLVILDVAMPRLTGLQAAREIARRDPHPRMLMLSMYDNEQYFLADCRSGGAYGSTSPTRMAYLVSSVRSRMPSLSRMLDRCRSTVLILIVNRWAISLEEWPSAIS